MEKPPFKVGDKVEFFDWNNNGKFLRRGVVRRIDEYESGYNLHLKCEYVCHLGNSAVVYPLKQEVRIIKE